MQSNDKQLAAVLSVLRSCRVPVCLVPVKKSHDVICFCV